MNEATMNEKGVIYVLTNPAMPGMVKIGRTEQDVDNRLGQLYTTGVPLPFECAYAAKVANAGEVEKAFHKAFEPQRVNPNREFFIIEPEQVIGLLKLIALEDMTPTFQEEAEQVDREAKASAEKLRSSRRPNMNFQEMGIPVGSRLDFNEGDHECIVINGRQVEYEGSEWYLSRLTQHLLGVDRSIRGPAHWSFNGSNLTDIYEDTYASDM